MFGNRGTCVRAEPLTAVACRSAVVLPLTLPISKEKVNSSKLAVVALEASDDISKSWSKHERKQSPRNPLVVDKIGDCYRILQRGSFIIVKDGGSFTECRHRLIVYCGTTISN